MVSDVLTMSNEPLFHLQASFLQLRCTSLLCVTYVYSSEPPNAPNGLEVVITAHDTTPVTAVIFWMALMGSATGIPPGGNQTLRYFVEVSNSSSGVLFSTTVEHPTNMTEAPNLPACETLTVSVTAENLFFNGTTAKKDFVTVEPGELWLPNMVSVIHMLTVTMFVTTRGYCPIVLYG